MKTIYALVLSVALPFAALAADTTVQALGTPFSHDWIWSIYTNIQSQLAEKQDAILSKKDRIAALKIEIAALTEDLNTPAVLSKGEFETTTEWKTRLEQLNAKHRSEKQAAIDSDNREIVQLKEELAKVQDVAKTNPTRAEISLPPTIRFYLQVEMGAYDADTETVSHFEPATKIQQYPDYVTVAKAGGVESVFDFAGCLHSFDTIRVPIAKARKLREADNQGNLWIGFTAKPKQISFSEGYTLTNITEVKMVENLLPSAKVLGARLLASAIGADPGAVPDDPVPQYHKESRYLGDVNHEARIIHTGWEGVPVPDAFYFYDNLTGRLTPIE